MLKDRLWKHLRPVLLYFKSSVQVTCLLILPRRVTGSRFFHHNLFTINSYSLRYFSMVLHLLMSVNFHILQKPTKSDQTARSYRLFLFHSCKLLYDA